MIPAHEGDLVEISGGEIARDLDEIAQQQGPILLWDEREEAGHLRGRVKGGVGLKVG